MVETFDCTNINLKKYSKGAQVTLLQTHLKTLGYYTTYQGSYLKIDGDFGPYTELAVKAFQKATGHTQDGVFGPKTCPSLNELILKKEGITNSTTGSTVSPVSPTITKVTSNPNQIDTTKNVISPLESDISVQGIYFIATSIKYNTPFRNGDWKRTKMRDNSNLLYQDLENPRQYTIETSLTIKEYNQLKNELYKLGNQVCKVVSNLLESGMYTFEITGLEKQKLTDMKITFELIEAS